MPTAGPLKPNHKAIQAYYEALKTYAGQHVEHEGALETAFSRLLSDTARPHGWMLTPKYEMKVRGKRIVPDGVLRDEFSLVRGYWEAKDPSDKLDAEIRKKIAKGYPLNNTIFEDTREAVLFFQNGQQANRFDLTNPQQLVDLLNGFYAFTEPDIEGFEQAVQEFKERVPELAGGLADKIKTAHRDNPRFEAAFGKFFELCQQTLNPNIRRDAVDEMLVQHLLTERLFRTIFNDPDFTRRNVIAAEIESVIDALTSQSFSRTEFLKSLDRFYRAIEEAAKLLTEFKDKQHFLNTVYERFFQGYSVKLADTHGIVYTPQEIVDFMCASVAEVLEKEFGLTLGSPGVNILDPCTGTGNFIVNILRRIPKKDLPRMYAKQLFANEMMLLPYYIAALNIEHAYYELTGKYEPFEGLCFVDTLDLAEEKPHLFTEFSERNTERVERQKDAQITVIIGNPPYNAHQANENDQNRNRDYPVIDQRVEETYIRDSTARLRSAGRDVFVKFYRWATDRLNGRPGIVCFVSNNSFVKKDSLDGMRKHLARDFDLIHHFDCLGDARTLGSERQRQGGNVFHDTIRVGVGVTVLVRRPTTNREGIRYHCVPDTVGAEVKLAELRSYASASRVPWKVHQPSAVHDWFGPANEAEFNAFTSMGNHEAKTSRQPNVPVVFKSYCRGAATNGDAYVYDFNRECLRRRAEALVEDFNSTLDRWRRSERPVDVDRFLEGRIDERVHKWIRKTKKVLRRDRHLTFNESRIRRALYRPFDVVWAFADRDFNEDLYSLPLYFPTAAAGEENRLIVVSDIASRAPGMSALCTSHIPDLHLCASTDSHQSFPFYVYDEDGSNRRENITDWALTQFRERYASNNTTPQPPSEPAGLSLRKDRRDKPGGSQSARSGGSPSSGDITKWDIFHYVYGILHHPAYRTKFADNLKRELPRIPFAPDFWAFANAGKELAWLHLDYEQLEPYPLKFIETANVPLSYRVEDKMRLNKDKTELRVNPSLTLAGIPPAVFDYRLGNRSALDWVIDQYRVTEDQRSGIRSDPNRADDPDYIVRLVGQVIQVSLQTVKIVNALPEQFCAKYPAEAKNGK